MGRHIVAILAAALVLSAAAHFDRKDKSGATLLRRDTNKQAVDASQKLRKDDETVARHAHHYVDHLRVNVTASAHRLQQHVHGWLHSLSGAAVITTIALQLSPLPSTLEIRRNRDVLRYDGYPYFAVFAGATQWCIYGTYAAWTSGEKAFFTMVVANGPGMFLGIFYISTFFRFVRTEDYRNIALKRFLCIGAGILLMELGTCIVLGSGAVFWLGLLGAFGSAQIACSPFKTLPEVIRTKSCKSWPLNLIWWNLVQSLATGGFGVANNDCWVWLPNLIGVIAACGQLFFVGLYPEQVLSKGSLGFNIHNSKLEGAPHGSTS